METAIYTYGRTGPQIICSSVQNQNVSFANVGVLLLSINLITFNRSTDIKKREMSVLLAKPNPLVSNFRDQTARVSKFCVAVFL